MFLQELILFTSMESYLMTIIGSQTYNNNNNSINDKNRKKEDGKIEEIKNKKIFVNKINK